MAITEPMVSASDEMHDTLISRLGVVLDWTNALHGECVADRDRIHEESSNASRDDVTFCVELTWSKVGPLSSRLIRRGVTDPSAALEEVRDVPPLFDEPEVVRLFARPGFVAYKRHIESVELLRVLLRATLEQLVLKSERSSTVICS